MAEFSNDKFIIESDGWRFEDSIVMPIEEFTALTPEQLIAMKQDRFIQWRDRITNPVQPDEEIIPEQVLNVLPVEELIE